MIRILSVVLLTLAIALPAAAQSAVTQSDIQRLQENVYQADRDVAQLRGRDATRASQLQAELDDLRDEVIYLKVKLRKEQSLARAEYGDVRDRIEDLRTRARGDATGAYSAPAATPAPATPAAAAAPPASTPAPQAKPAGASRTEVPVGTEIDVRLQSSLNSGTAQVEDRFEATTLTDLRVDGRDAIPAGAVMRGVVSSVERATRTNRTAKMTVTFDEITVNGRTHRIRATVTEAIKGEGIKGELGRTGIGAAAGTIIGAAIGGVKGAVLGAVIGGGGTIAATEGREVEIPQGTILRVRIDAPIVLD